MKTLAALLAALWLCACAASDGYAGYVDQGKLSQLTVGRTTYTEVAASWGQPTGTSTLPDGRRVATYPYMWRETGPVTVVPGGGPVSSTETRTGQVTLNFDRQGVLQSYQAPR